MLLVIVDFMGKTNDKLEFLYIIASVLKSVIFALKSVLFSDQNRLNSHKEPCDLYIRTLLASRATASAPHIVTSTLPKIHIHYTHKRAPFYGCLLCLALARLHHEIHLGINYHILVS